MKIQDKTNTRARKATRCLGIKASTIGLQTSSLFNQEYSIYASYHRTNAKTLLCNELVQRQIERMLTESQYKLMSYLC